MRLTNEFRDAFINAVMADVPMVEYDELVIKAAERYLVAKMPPKIRAIYEDKNLRDWLRVGYNDQAHIHVYGGDRYKLDDLTMAEIEQLEYKQREQQAAHSELRKKLKAVAYSVTTHKALAKALPEFEKYLPDVDALDRSVPAVANVIADFVKAGWPNGKGAAA